MTIPIIGIPADYVRGDKPPSHHRVYDKYLEVVESLGAIPIIIPAIGHRADVLPILRLLNGILLPGSISNVHPTNFGRTQEMENPVDNPERDATTLILIRTAIEQGVPVFGICRGHQEINVAMGGTLHQQLDKIPGKRVHQLSLECTMEQLLGHSHEATLPADSKLREWLGTDRVTINSAHNQAVDTLGKNVVVEAIADDGTIEAIRVINTPGFAYGTQWHPEYRFAGNPISQALFAAFGQAVHNHANSAKPAI